jgi:Kef-type K+ transport system membrane component KefB
MRAALPSIVPTSRLVAAYVSLYVVPMIALLLALATLAPRLPSRWLGALALIAIYLVVSFAARYLSGHFFDLVEASG